jgi:hypothetical protein
MHCLLLCIYTDNFPNRWKLRCEMAGISDYNGFVIYLSNSFFSIGGYQRYLCSLFSPLFFLSSPCLCGRIFLGSNGL